MKKMNKDVIQLVSEIREIGGVQFGVYSLSRRARLDDALVEVGHLIGPTKLFAEHGEEHDGDRGLSTPRGSAAAVATAADEGGELGLDELKTARRFKETLATFLKQGESEIGIAPLPIERLREQPVTFVPKVVAHTPGFSLNEVFERAVERTMQVLGAVAKAEGRAQPRTDNELLTEIMRRMEEHAPSLTRTDARARIAGGVARLIADKANMARASRSLHLPTISLREIRELVTAAAIPMAEEQGLKMALANLGNEEIGLRTGRGGASAARG